jgi:hypothetical protein
MKKLENTYLISSYLIAVQTETQIHIPLVPTFNAAPYTEFRGSVQIPRQPVSNRRRP